MDVAEITVTIKEIVSQVVAIPVSEIGDDTPFVEGLHLDSLSLLEIGVDVDYAFKLGLPDERLKSIRCVRDAVALVHQQLEARGATGDTLEAEPA